MTARIDKLEIVGFRGATKPLEIHFDTSKPVTMIFGENGTGKSTVADAFDFACNGKYGSLEDRSFSGQNKTHVVSAGQPASAVSVRLVSGAKTWTTTLSTTGPVTSGTDCPDASILRRSSVSKLINAEPKARFKELRDFIAVPGVEKSETTLRAAIKDVDRDLRDAIAAAEQARQSLDQLWNTEGSPETDALAWAKTESGKDLSTLKSAVTEARSLLDAIRDAETRIESLDFAATTKEQASKTLATAQESLAKGETAGAEQDGDLVTLLNTAKEFVAVRQDMVSCPVCEQPVDAKALVAKLGERLTALQSIAILVSAVQAAKKKLTLAKSVWTQSLKNACLNAKKLGYAVKESKTFQPAPGTFDWSAFSTLLAHDAASTEVGTEARSLVVKASALRTDIEHKKDADQKSINQQNAITGHLKTLSTNDKAKLSLDAVLTKLKGLLEVIESHRKSYIDGILIAISGDVEKLYEKMHPGEGIGKIRLFLKNKAIGSLEMDGNFQGKTGVPFQAYYSESHLDTLGICVFLALALKFKTDNTIVILDDVVTSVDSVHLDRFMTLLHEQATKFNQLIVTTHYRPWRDRYRYARGATANIQVLDLRRWSFDSGIQTDEMKTFVKEVEGCLSASPIDRQAIASKAGIQLENLLDFLTLQYQCKLPRQADPNYTLGTLWSGVSSKLAKQLKTCSTPATGGDKVETELKPIMDELMEKTWIRNSEGCHFRVVPSEIPEAEVEEFGKNVVKLSKLIVCEACGSFPMRRPSGSHWECGCGNTELHPLVEPGKSLGSIPDEK